MRHTYSTKRPQSKGPASKGPALKGPAKKGWALKDLGYTRSRERKILDLEHRSFRHKTLGRDIWIQNGRLICMRKYHLEHVYFETVILVQL
jgi:hypothetical protein